MLFFFFWLNLVSLNSFFCRERKLSSNSQVIRQFSLFLFSFLLKVIFSLDSGGLLPEVASQPTSVPAGVISLLSLSLSSPFSLSKRKKNRVPVGWHNNHVSAKEQIALEEDLMRRLTGGKLVRSFCVSAQFW